MTASLPKPIWIIAVNKASWNTAPTALIKSRYILYALLRSLQQPICWHTRRQPASRRGKIMWTRWGSYHSRHWVLFLAETKGMSQGWANVETPECRSATRVRLGTHCSEVVCTRGQLWMPLSPIRQWGGKSLSQRDSIAWSKWRHHRWKRLGWIQQWHTWAVDYSQFLTNIHLK